MRLALILALLASPAFAQQTACAKHDVMVQMLKDQFGEVPQSGGIIRTGKLLEMLANPETGTWTVIVTNQFGDACIPAAGDRFAIIPPGDPA